MYTKLNNCITSYDILNNNGYGFREKHSAYTALLNVIDQISNEIDNKNYSVGIFIDLSRLLMLLMTQFFIIN